MALSLYDLNRDKAGKDLVTESSDGLMSRIDKKKFNEMTGTITNLQERLSTLVLSGGSVTTLADLGIMYATATEIDYLSGVTSNVQDQISALAANNGTVTTLADLGITVTSTEINYLAGTTSNIQEQINDKADSNHIHSTLTLADFGIIATSAEINYLAGTTSNIQEQINDKADSNHIHSTLTLADFGITATSTEINILKGVSGVNSTQINYLSGATGNIQTQLNSKVSTLSNLGITATAANINYTSGTTSNIQQQISTLTNTDSNISTALSTHTHNYNSIYAAINHVHSALTLTDLGITATSNEINYLSGTTSNIQQQISALAAGGGGGGGTVTTLTDLGITATSTEINYLTGTTNNIQQQISTLSSSVVSRNTDVRKLLYHGNKCANSSFEVFNFTTGIPDYWSTTCIVSPNSNFDGNYSLELTAGQVVIQKAEADGGLWNPSWWSDYPNTRISFRCKKSGTTGTIVVEVVNSTNVAQQLTSSYYDSITGKWLAGTSGLSLAFAPGTNWSEGFFTFTAACTANDYHRIRFTNSGDTTLYLDAITVEPDLGGYNGPSIYRPGIRSTGPIDIGGRNLYVSTEDPIGIANNGDLWIEIII